MHPCIDMMNKKKRGQVWIETVIYTLIALTIMGIVLGIVSPELNKIKDRASIRQSADVLNEIDGRINDIKFISGNSRNMKIKITRGKLIIDGEKDMVQIVIDDSSYAVSELGLKVYEGNIIENTTAKGKKYMVTMTLDYENKLNITNKGMDGLKTFQYANVPYKISIINNGGNVTDIDFF